jgi:hypothetical protein
MFSKEAWVLVNGYDKTMTTGAETFFEDALKLYGYWSYDRDLAIKDTFFVYRYFPEDKKYSNISQMGLGKKLLTFEQAQDILTKDAKKGTIEIEPHWKQDYMELI